MQAAPFWQVGETREEALRLTGLLEDWDLFRQWVSGLDKRFTHLKKLVKTGRATDRSKLGRELIEAWTNHAGDRSRLYGCVESLGQGISFRIIHWIRQCDYRIQPDPAVLVLFPD